MYTVPGNTITQGSTGKTYIYTGHVIANGWGFTLSDLGAFDSELYFSPTGSNLQNAALNKAYGDTITDGANAQILFRATE